MGNKNKKLIVMLAGMLLFIACSVAGILLTIFHRTPIPAIVMLCTGTAIMFIAVFLLEHLER